MNIRIEGVDKMGFPIIIKKTVEDMRSETLILSAVREAGVEFNRIYFMKEDVCARLMNSIQTGLNRSLPNSTTKE